MFRGLVLRRAGIALKSVTPNIKDVSPKVTVFVYPQLTIYHLPLTGLAAKRARHVAYGFEA